MANKNEDNPSVHCQAYEDQMPDWTLVNDCFAGTRAIRDKGNEYLPQNPSEFQDDYNTRLSQANFWNASKRTRDGLVGMVFRKNPVLAQPSEDEDERGEMADVVPPEILKHLENVDLQGCHFDVFTKEVFRDALSDGHSFILVDMPPALPVDDPTVTRRDEIGRRPYWVRINKEQVINWRAETNLNGVTELTQVTIREDVVVPAGDFLDAMETRYLVLRPGSWERFKVEEKDKETAVTRLDGGDTSLDVIPLAPVYTNRVAFMVSSPPLLDLCFENLRHYRLQSDLDTIMHVCNVPILTALGRKDTEEKLVVGPFTAVDLPVDGDLKYAEHSGAAIPAAQQELSNSKANMATLGLLLLSQRPQVAQTATESVIDDKAESSELAGMARGLEDGIETALMYHAMYLGQKSGGSVTVNKDFAKLGLEPQKITAISTAVEKRQLSLETMWEIMQRADELPNTFDAKKEQQRLKESEPESEQLNVERQKIAIERDKQMMSGNPEAITQRILSERMNMGGPPS